MQTSCPVCKESSLTEHEPEVNLRARKCDKCTGVWIGALHYAEWLAKHGDNLPERPPEEGISLTSGEKPGIKFCPDCKYVLMKYKVGHDVGFSLNRCGQCAGIWFDQNEWEIMKSRNLHDTSSAFEIFSPLQLTSPHSKIVPDYLHAACRRTHAKHL